MKAIIQHKIKRIKQKTYFKFKKTFDASFAEQIDNQQLTAYFICKRLIDKEGTILLMAPLSGKRYIKKEDENLFIIINSDNVQIINHVYSYIIPMSGRIFKKTLKVFDNKLESNREKLEMEVKGNIQNSLNQIKNDLKKDV